MASLTDEKRQEIRQEIAGVLSREHEEVSLTKADLKAAVDAADQWVDDNRASYNSALPAAAQSGLTASQKARLLQFVVQKRFVEGV